jgi:hypothetical protein
MVRIGRDVDHTWIDIDIYRSADGNTAKDKRK